MDKQEDLKNNEAENENQSSKPGKNEIESDKHAFSIPQGIPLNSSLNNKILPPQLNYEKPTWSADPPRSSGESVLDSEGYCDHFFLEVIKNGSIVEKILLNKPFLTLGRFESADIIAEHPTISRFHSIFQYSNGLIDSNYPEGFYLFDLGSTHGTFLNKNRIESKKYIKINLGSILKFGQSTRLYVLNGPKAKYSSDDLTINLTHEQMKKIKEKHSQLSLKLKVKKELEEEERLEKEKKDLSGVSWGMDHEGEQEAQKDENEDENLESTNINEVDESFFSSDPKKALKNYFDREGYELSYDIEELGPGKYKCRIELPITNDYGEPIYSEIQHEGKKKDSMTVCALDACRILNSQGCLKNSKQNKKRKEKDWESADFYDSDDDSFYDRTGDIEKKRLHRMEKAGKSESSNMLTKQKDVSITFDMILNDIKMMLLEQSDLEIKLDKCKQIIKAVSDDDIDAYINSLKTNQTSIDAVTRAKMKKRLAEIKNELVRLDRLLQIAKPKDFDYNNWKEGIEKKIKSEENHLPITENKKPKVDINKEILNEEQPKIQNEKLEANVAQKLKKEQIDLKLDKVLEEKNSIQENNSCNKPIIKQDVDRSIVSKPKKMKQEIEENLEYEKLNPDNYSIWQPPKDQSGDGKTHLNEKFGY